MPPRTDGILESSLYVDDVAASARFYEKIFGFPVMVDFGGRGCALKAGSWQVLLLFKKGGSLAIAFIPAARFHFPFVNFFIPQPLKTHPYEKPN